MESLDDKYLIKRITGGETDLFGCLVDRYGQRVFSLIVRVVKNREDAEELAQDTFLKAFRALSKFKGDCSFSTWIYQIAYNTAISYTRKKKYEFLTIDNLVIDDVTEEKINEVFSNEDTSQLLEELDKALKCLLPEERALVSFFYNEKIPIEQIASISGLSVSNVKTRLYRIRKKLAVIMQQFV
ncbi:RNA polymerase sigma factor [Coprobacter tertius]|uniref:RNA polymerase sigma factor n=1 Tax=Coprobacter tertius TaxID=2944915 RepID=A0ABT1MI36_9BACT|nr:sigma-70 family RNA polymerase sigma factor [Coprobacter tertius]MCP9612289.1 sigma-70 family RNA polymerase sigma factor [Coprobacter tertius]